MRLSRRAYPHPVVGNSDDVDAAFQAPVEVIHDGMAYYLSVQVQTSSKTIKRLISEERAAYVLHVECSNTLYRKAYEFSEDEREFRIPGTQYLLWLFRKSWLPAGLFWAEDAADELLQTVDERCVA